MDLNSAGGGQTVFCNPPYGRAIKDWVKKSSEEVKKPNTTVVMLIPARTDTSYFHDYIYVVLKPLGILPSVTHVGIKSFLKRHRR